MRSMQRIRPGFETQGRRHPKSKTVVSVAHEKDLCLNFFKKKKKFKPLASNSFTTSTMKFLTKKNSLPDFTFFIITIKNEYSRAYHNKVGVKNGQSWDIKIINKAHSLYILCTVTAANSVTQISLDTFFHPHKFQNIFKIYNFLKMFSTESIRNN